MKKILLTIAIVMAIQASYACDVCGCSSSGTYFGILPDYRNNFVAFKYHYRSFTSRHLAEYGYPEDISQDKFQTVELWTRFNIKKRWQLFVMLPFNSFSQQINGVHSSIKGIGDATAILSYKIINADDKESLWKQSLQIGAGIKLPTGSSNKIIEGSKANPNLQPGTGTIDFPLSLIYTARYKNVGVNTEASYKINTYNKDNFGFGNKFNAAASLFYLQQGKQISLLPHAGISYETAAKDFDGIEISDYSGGSALNMTAGLDVYLKRVSVGFNWQQPVKTNLGQGRIDPHARISTSVSFLF